MITLTAWLVLAYVVLPSIWRHYEHNPALADAPKTTLTSQGIPGDPLNVGLIAGEEHVVRALHAAGWSPADPITLASCVRIAESVVFKRPDPDAPVSSLFLFGRRQDLAFEKPVGGNARHRHHVRFWKWLEGGHSGRPIWIGSATYDRERRLQPSHRTGDPSHRARYRRRAPWSFPRSDRGRLGRQDLSGDRGRERPSPAATAGATAITPTVS